MSVQRLSELDNPEEEYESGPIIVDVENMNKKQCFFALREFDDCPKVEKKLNNRYSYSARQRKKIRDGELRFDS